MPTTTFTQEQLQQYFSGRYTHAGYEDTVDMASDMAIHADGIYPKEMIEERRPSESLKVKEYREKIWKPVTKPTYGKVITELNKIRRSSDWSIKYDETEIPPKVVPEETLKQYCELNYPYFTSVTNWAFTMLLPLYAKDANALVVVMPIEFEKPANDYPLPFGYIFKSEQVLYFKEDDYAVIKSADKVFYTDDQDNERSGDVFYIITTEKLERWEQGNEEFILASEYEHNIKRLPAFKVKGLFKEAMDDLFIYESRLAAMLPRLDEALREYSDLQAEIVQNIFSERWEYNDNECPKCKGKKVIKDAGFNGEVHTCPVCEGSGVMARGPYSTLYVKAPMAGELQMPTPPAGILQKSVEIAKLQDDRIDKHEYKALASINMEYLAQTPLNESGTAKEVDKDSLNNFVHSVAEDIVAVLDKLYYFINEYRYSVVVPNISDRIAMLPYINVPDKFDLLSATYLEDQIAKQKENKGNPIIINAMEEDYVNKKFVADNLLREKVLLSIRLDPLSGISEDDKMLRLSNKGITLETYIVSSNITAFIARAMDENGDNFIKMKLKEQKQLMTLYAQEQLSANSASGKLLQLQQPENESMITGGVTI